MGAYDMEDVHQRTPLVLTTEDLAGYDVKYVGRQRVDELDTYVFDAKPLHADLKHRFFEGRVWVDQKDLEERRSFGCPEGFVQCDRPRSDVAAAPQAVAPGLECFQCSLIGCGFEKTSAGRGTSEMKLGTRDQHPRCLGGELSSHPPAFISPLFDTETFGERC